MTTKTIDLVSAKEIAQRLDVRPQTVHVWQHRGIFPPPDIRLGVGPIWHWATIEAWAKQTGRLK